MVLGLFYQSGGAAATLPAVMVFLALGGVLFYIGRASQRRSESLRKLAKRRGLEGVSYNLPREFPRKMLDELYSGWAVPRWSGPHNVIAGAEGSDLVVAFDVTIQRRKSTYRRTIIARRSADFQPKSKIPKGYVYRAADGWQLMTPESRSLSVPHLMSAAEIERGWEVLR
jgi:hypothetical protein